MNDAQLEILMKFGNDSISIDETHELNAYHFQLYTILVLRQGIPACFLFSNRGDVCLNTTQKLCLNLLCSTWVTFYYA